MKNPSVKRIAIVSVIILLLAVSLLSCPAPGGHYEDQVATPQFNLPPGSYTDDQSVSITTTTPEATIYYTTDGSAPTAASPVYSVPIAITGNGTVLTLKAYAGKSGMTDSAVGSGTYMISYNITALWATTVGTGLDESRFCSTSVDSSGNVYAAGYISGTATYTFGVGVTAAGPGGNRNVVLVKYNSSGTAQWARTVSTGTSSYFYSAAVDSGGNIYAAGYLYGTASYGFGGGITAAGTSTQQNVVLVKYDSSGTAEWARTVSTGTSSSYFYSTAVDSFGNVYAAGAITSTTTYTFGSGVTAAGAYSPYTNVVLVKYDSSGTALWARTVSTAQSDSWFYTTAADSGGNVYAAGVIGGTHTFTFGPGVTATATSNVGYKGVLVKYDSFGTALWARTTTFENAESRFLSIAIDSFGNAYAAGTIYGNGTYSFGGGVTIAGVYSPYTNVVLVKYDPTGAALWARTITTGTEASRFTSTAADTSGNVYAAGYVGGMGTYTFGSGITAAGTNSSSGPNAILVKYDSSGAAQWARTVSTGTSESLFNSASVDSEGNIFAAGSISGTGIYTFGRGVTAAGTSNLPNVLLVKYLK